MLKVVDAEDSGTMRQRIAMGLARGDDVRVHEAADGIGALQLVVTEGADVLMTDLQTPVMEAVTLIAAVRSESRMGHLRSALMTTEDGDRDQTMHLGAEALVAKAIELRQVDALVHDLRVRT